MVSLSLMRQQQDYYKKNKKEILESLSNTGNRYAVINGCNVSSFKCIEEVYQEHSMLDPNSELIFGTSPLLIDYEKETNSKLYQTEEAIKELRKANRLIIKGKRRRKDLINKIRELRN